MRAWIGRRPLGPRIVWGVPRRPVSVPPICAPKLTAVFGNLPRLGCEMAPKLTLELPVWSGDASTCAKITFCESLEDRSGRRGGNVSQSALCGWRAACGCILPLANTDSQDRHLWWATFRFFLGKIRIVLFRSTSSYRSCLFGSKEALFRVSTWSKCTMKMNSL